MVFDWHSQDSRASGPLEVAHTVTQQYGTGGGNTPMVVHDGLLCRATGQAGAETLTDCAPCLNCDHEAPIVAGCLNPEDNQSRRIYGEGGAGPDTVRTGKRGRRANRRVVKERLRPAVHHSLSGPAGMRAAAGIPGRLGRDRPDGHGRSERNLVLDGRICH